MAMNCEVLQIQTILKKIVFKPISYYNMKMGMNCEVLQIQTILKKIVFQMMYRQPVLGKVMTSICR